MTQPRIVATIEARMASSRLPGKVLLDVGGRPALSRQLARMRRARRLDAIVLATSVNPLDDDLARWAEREDVAIHRGSEEDVLGRVVGALEAAGAEVAVPLCGDCPMIDPAVIDMAVDAFLSGGCDFVTNSIEPGFPQGQDVQVARARDLADIAARIDDPAVHEHTCLYLHEHPERFRTRHLSVPDAWRAPHRRMQMDYPEDLALIRTVYARLDGPEGFGIADILDLLDREPDIAALNAHCEERAARPEAASR